MSKKGVMNMGSAICRRMLRESKSDCIERRIGRSVDGAKIRARRGAVLVHPQEPVILLASRTCHFGPGFDDAAGVLDFVDDSGPLPKEEIHPEAMGTG